MLENIPLQNILFLDIETVPIVEFWDELPKKAQELWTKKTQYQLKENQTSEELFIERAGIWAEFGKIVCISCGIIVHQKIRIRSFTGKEEKILLDFNDLLRSDYFNTQVIFCAHNGKEFDFPYIARRMIIHGIELPNPLKMHGKKPWEIPHLDTLELWKFGDFKHYTSLDLMAYIFGLETPKEDIDGSQVAEVYYKEKNIARIQRYCENDVFTLINVFLKLRLQNPLERDH